MLPAIPADGGDVSFIWKLVCEKKSKYIRILWMCVESNAGDHICKEIALHEIVAAKYWSGSWRGILCATSSQGFPEAALDTTMQGLLYQTPLTIVSSTACFPAGHEPV